MNSLNQKQKIVAAVILLGLALITIFTHGLYNPKPALAPQTTQGTNGNQPKVISTNPSSLDQATIVPTQVFEITFNKPLKGSLETHPTMDPKVNFKVDLANDDKTLRITPEKPFDLGQSYTLLIPSETKFRDDTKLEQDYTYHFKTLPYSGV